MPMASRVSPFMSHLPHGPARGHCPAQSSAWLDTAADDSPTHSCGFAARLEFRAAAEAELLDPIVTLLGKRERIVEAQRTERRVPDQADADRGADGAGIRRRLK